MKRFSIHLFFILTVFLIFWSCGESDPQLEVTPTELDFGTEETQKKFSVQNIGVVNAERGYTFSISFL